MVVQISDYDHDGGTNPWEYGFTNTISGAGLGPEGYTATLINGKGRFWDKTLGRYNQAPLTVFTCASGDKYRFRVIHAGSQFPHRVSIEGHSMTLVASDGGELEPTPIESFIVNPGEGIDVEVTCDQPVGNYW